MRFNRKKQRKLKGNANNKTYLITLEGDIRKEVPPSVQCTCGWVEGPDTNLMKLGEAAKAHAIENPGHMLRHHG